MLARVYARPVSSAYRKFVLWVQEDHLRGFDENIRARVWGGGTESAEMFAVFLLCRSHKSWNDRFEISAGKTRAHCGTFAVRDQLVEPAEARSGVKVKAFQRECKLFLLHFQITGSVSMQHFKTNPLTIIWRTLTSLLNSSILILPLKMDEYFILL